LKGGVSDEFFLSINELSITMM